MNDWRLVGVLLLLRLLAARRGPARSEADQQGADDNAEDIVDRIGMPEAIDGRGREPLDRISESERNADARREVRDVDTEEECGAAQVGCLAAEDHRECNDGEGQHRQAVDESNRRQADE